MSKLISIQDVTELYGKSEGSIHGNAHYFMKIHNRHPEWYVKRNNKIFIDVELMNKPSEILKKTWHYNTDSLAGIYWLLSYALQYSDNRISDMLSRASQKFKNKSTWTTFLSRDMFCIPPETKVTPEYGMHIDFIVICTWFIYRSLNQGDIKREMIPKELY